MDIYKVTSEIHTECNDSTMDCTENHVTRTFSFVYPTYLSEAKNQTLQYDDDGDLILKRPKKGNLTIEYSVSTELELVGLQVWRGALVLADYILSHPHLFAKKKILELGTGVGLTSIVASLVANEIICTDVNVGGILRLIESNFERNKNIVRSKFTVMELNFLDPNWSCNLREKLNDVTIILAADGRYSRYDYEIRRPWRFKEFFMEAAFILNIRMDYKYGYMMPFTRVIYDDRVTDGFVNTLAKLFDENSSRIAYVTLEKRYVFTIANLESVAPMYEEFLRCIERRNLDWIIEHLDINFSQYFTYDRVEEMILMRIQKKKVNSHDK